LSAAAAAVARHAFYFKPVLNVFTRGYTMVENGYPNVIRWALNHRGMVLGVAFSLLSFQF
jgi:multidrug efflux pump subunit AcrB